MKFTNPTIIRYLFFVTASILVVFGVGSLLRPAASSEMRSIYSVYAALMFGDALALLVCGLFLPRRVNLIYRFAVLVLSLNIILTFFDQVGLIDLLFVLLNMVTLVALLNQRKDFLPQ